MIIIILYNTERERKKKNISLNRQEYTAVRDKTNYFLGHLVAFSAVRGEGERGRCGGGGGGEGRDRQRERGSSDNTKEGK